ncbi:MAG TPA: AsmA-like C-terminal region-containing protein [Chitinivibrionales bacterium]
MKKGWLRLLRRHRMVSVAAGALLAVILFVMCIGFIPLSNTMVKTTVERLVRESLPGEITWKSMTITLWTGITLKDVRYSFKEPGGLALDCSLERITIAYYLLPIFFKHVIVKNISLQQPVLRVDLGGSGVTSRSSGQAFSLDALSRVLGTLPYTVAIRAVSLSEGRVLIRKDNKEQVDCSGISCAMSVELKRMLQMAGRLEIGHVRLFNAWSVASLKASVHINGVEAAIDNCRASVYGGTLSLKGSVDITKGELDTCTVELDDMKLEDWYRLAGVGPGTLTGALDGAMKLTRSALAADSLTGKGWVKMTDVSARDIPLQKNLLVLLVVPKLATMRFNRIYSDLVLKNGRVYTKKCVGRGDPLNFSADGWVGLNGALSENAEGIFSADFVRELPPLIKNSLLPVPDNSDERSFKCSFSGAFKNPKCSVDERIQRRAVGNVIDEIGKGLERLFRR